MQSILSSFYFERIHFDKIPHFERAGVTFYFKATARMTMLQNIAQTFQFVIF